MDGRAIHASAANVAIIRRSAHPKLTFPLAGSELEANCQQ